MKGFDLDKDKVKVLKSQSMPACYILITTNLRTYSRVILATEIVQGLLTSKYWLLGGRTPNRGRIRISDKVIICAAGLANRVFLAIALVASPAEPISRRVKKAIPEELIEKFSFEYPNLYSLELAEPAFFNKPIPVKQLLDRLSFIKNRNSWGSYFQGGHLRIAEEDFALMVTQDTNAT